MAASYKAVIKLNYSSLVKQKYLSPGSLRLCFILPSHNIVCLLLFSCLFLNKQTAYFH